MNTQDTANVPPDGKWGWIIVLAYALNGLSTISIVQGFGLIFKDTFPIFGFNATQGTIIINTNLAFGMILGLINGPLLRIFGYRKMAVIGSLFYSTGVMLTAFAKTFTLLMISYGILTSLGICMTLSAFSYALNSYFTTKRGRAISLAVTIIGFGPIILPQITTFLISYYGFQGTILLYGAFSLHSLVGSALLHPLKWHTKKAKKSEILKESTAKDGNEEKTEDSKNASFQNEESPNVSMSDLSFIQRRRRTTVSSIDHDAEIGSIYGIDIPYARQMSETLNAPVGEKEVDVYRIIENGQSEKRNPKRQSRNRAWYKSVDTINLGSSFTIFEEGPIKKYSSTNEFEMNNYGVHSTMENDSLIQKHKEDTASNGKVDRNESPDEISTMRRIFKTIREIFDLDLLRDPIYVNIMLGMSTAIFAEINFSQLTPFILMDMKLSTKQVASVMSVIASVDLVFRSLAPFIGERLRQPPRIMYLSSLCLLIVSRTSLLFVNGFVSMLIVAFGLGAAKGIRSVYMSLVIPSYVPINRLPNASGIQMIANGVLLLSAGPMLGVMRDNIGNYTPSIIMINCVTALTVTMWSVEMLIGRRRKARNQKEQQAGS